MSNVPQNTREDNPRRWTKLAAVILLAVGSVLSVPGLPAAETGQERDQRMAWWREARFGLFIHFGLFSLPAEKQPEQYRYWSTTLDEFQAMMPQFNPVRFDADQWVRHAKTAGMKYIVLVTKSHDGWCLFDSQHTELDVMATPYQRDILKPLAEACRREGLRICWYYSIMDWAQPDYPVRRAMDKRPAAGAELDRYVAYMKSQLKELLTSYGPIGVLWFDGHWERVWTETAERGEDLYRYVRRLQPDIIVNNRVGKDGQGAGSQGAGDVGDFATPEGYVPGARPTEVDWESCMTMNDHWQYKEYDHNWKAPADLIRHLADCAGKGGNYLLDVGPQPDGEFPQPAVERLEAIGRWMKVNGESIYGTQAGPFGRLPRWLRATAKPLAGGKTRLYLHVFAWPPDGQVRLGGLRNKVLGAAMLADRSRSPLGVSREAECVKIVLPKSAPDEADSVVVLDIEGAPEVAPFAITPGADGRLILRASEADIRSTGANVTAQYDPRPGVDSIGYWVDPRDWISWPLRVNQPGAYDVEVVYGAENGIGGGRYAVEIAGQKLVATARQTGGWAKFVTERIGTVELKPGPMQTLAVRIEDKPGLAVMDLREIRLLPTQKAAH